MGVQEQAPQTEPFGQPPGLLAGVLVISRERVPGVGSMHPDLVRAPGQRRRLHQRGRGEAGAYAKLRGRRPAAFQHFDHALAGGSFHFLQRGFNALQAARPAAGGQGKIALVDAARRTQQRMQLAQHCRPPGHQDQSGGFPIQPMHEFQASLLGIHAAQGFDQAEVDPATAMHRQPRRLGQNQQPRILQHHGVGQPLLPATGRDRRGAPPWHLERRQAHDVTERQAPVRAHAALVDAYFALAHRAVQTRFRHVRTVAAHEVVEPLPVATFVDGQQAHGLPLGAATADALPRLADGRSPFLYLPDCRVTANIRRVGQRVATCARICAAQPVTLAGISSHRIACGSAQPVSADKPGTRARLTNPARWHCRHEPGPLRKQTPPWGWYGR